MNIMRTISSLTAAFLVLCTLSLAQAPSKLADNAALRYWSAFAQMQDSAITDQQAKTLNSILDGTAPFEDAQYKDLLEKNRSAIDTMARGSQLRACDWGIEYQLGPEAPIDYVRKSLALGRINVLYAFHLLVNGRKDEAANTLAAGIRFAHHVSNGGPLFATLAAKNLLSVHLKAIDDAIHLEGFSPAQRSVLQKAIAELPAKGVDWPSAMQHEFQILRGLKGADATTLNKIMGAYLSALENPATLPRVQQMIAGRDDIPNPQRVVAEEKDLVDKLQKTRAMLKDQSNNADARSTNSGGR